MRQRSESSADCQKLGQEEGSPSKRLAKGMLLCCETVSGRRELSLGLRGQDHWAVGFPLRSLSLTLLWMPGVDMNQMRLIDSTSAVKQGRWKDQ